MLKKIITLIILYIITFTFIKVTIPSYAQSWLNHHAFYYFFISVVVGFFFFRKLSEKTPFYDTLRHELCHWFFALLSFSKPHSLNINGDGSGSYQHYGKHNYSIVLAPYFFPIATMFFMLMQVFFSHPAKPYYVLLGLAFAFDVSSMVKDYHLQQTDWRVYGITFSIQFSILLALIFSLSILVILFGGFEAYPKLLKQVYLLLREIIIGKG